ncbi:MAG: hypothetical protein WC219_04095 [Acholeplasmataceae bacterium]
MKKIVLVFLLVVSVFALAACKRGGTDLDLNYDEQIDAPTALKISGNMLSWNSVKDAKGYIIYINDVKVDTVDTNSYDFSSKIEDRMIFKVVTEAPRGMQDSVASVTIAYVKNKDAEISAIIDYIIDNDMSMSDEFAAELVNKGMLADEFTTMMDSMHTLVDDMPYASDLDDMYQLLDEAMDDVTNIEALVSAIVKTMLPEQIDDEIYWLEQDVVYYTELLNQDWGWNADYYQSRIDDLNAQIEALKDLKAEIITNSDNVVQSIMVAVNYVMSVQSMITDDLIDGLMEISETEELQDLNVSEFILVKEEVVNILTETMPELKDVTVMIKTLETFSEYAYEMQDVEVSLPSSAEKMAGQMLMSMEAFIRFIDMIDEEFIETMKEIDNDNISDHHKQAKSATLLVTYFDQYKKDNQGLFDQINDIYSDEEKEAILNDNIQILEDQMEDMEVDVDLSFMTFEVLMDMQIVFEDAFDDLLDAIVKSEGSFFMAVADMRELDDELYDKDYENRDYEEYYLMTDVYGFKMLNEASVLIHAVVSGRSENDYELVSNFMVQYVLEIGGISLGLVSNESDYEEFKEDFMTFYANTTTEQYDLIQSIVEYIDDNDVFLNVATDLEDAYLDDPEGRYDEMLYFSTVHMIRAYDDLMTRSNKSDLNIIIDELEALVQTDLIDDNYDGDNLADDLREIMTYLDTVSGEIADFDVENLSYAQKGTIDDVIEEIRDILTD